MKNNGGDVSRQKQRRREKSPRNGDLTRSDDRQVKIRIPCPSTFVSRDVGRKGAKKGGVQIELQYLVFMAT
jgi:hypothetical protein